MLKKNITNILLIISLTILLFGSGYKLGQFRTTRLILGSSGAQTSPKSSDNSRIKNLDFDLFWDTWNKIEDKYVDKKKINTKKMFYGAIKGMVASVEDQYTFFLTPEENKQSKDDLGGKFEGIGAQLGLKDNRIIIIAPLKNSPAINAGIRSGDYINKVDGQSTKGWSTAQAVSKIRGEKGTQVKLTVEREGKESEISIIRDVIRVASVELSYEKDIDCQIDCPKVAYLRLNQFGDKTNQEWDNATLEIEQKWKDNEIKGMVLDVRDNPGGYLDSAVYLASEFLPQGKLVVKQESTTEKNKDYYTVYNGRLQTIPLVILINQGSASASEILSGALRDYKRAVLIGEKSFGKGSVQEALDLKDGAGLHVTVAKWILPKGDWINAKGIEPGIKIENKIENGNTISRQTDVQLEKAVDEILKK